MRRFSFELYIIGMFCCFGCPRVCGQVLTHLETHTNAVAGVDGLDGPYGVAITSDALFVYTASSTSDAVALFTRNPATGSLTYDTAYVDDGQPGGTIAGLTDPKRLCISPDDRFVYVPASTNDAVLCFSRNMSTGRLTLVQTVLDGVGGVDGIDGAFHCRVSPDNNHLYVASYGDDAVAVFSRNTSTGVLTFVEAQANSMIGINGLNSIRHLAFSQAGDYLYTAASISDAIAIFSRNSTTGALTYQGMVQDGAGGVDGLNGAYSVEVSPDGNHLYTASAADDAVTAFSINTSTGALTYIATYKDNSQGGAVPDLNAARFAGVSNDGSFVFATASSDDALTVFSRNPTTGALTFVEEYKDGVAGQDGLNGVRCLAISPDDTDLITVASTSDAVAVFDRTSIVLPIELLTFSVEAIDQNVSLEWMTASEQEASHFIVERSTDSGNFMSIGQVDAVGGQSVTRYQFLDSDLFPGQYFYRLTMVDNNGASEQSPIKGVKVGHDADLELVAFPNPVQMGNQFTIRSASVDGMLYDLTGRKVSAIIRVQGNGVVVQTEHLNAGIYVWVEAERRTRIVVR